MAAAAGAVGAVRSVVFTTVAGGIREDTMSRAWRVTLRSSASGRTILRSSSSQAVEHHDLVDAVEELGRGGP
jgi:3-keto-L-gulonate-6-phosphate decarboxylase